MKMKKILNICLAAAVVCAAEGVSARTVSLSAPAEAPQPAAREAAAPMPADNTRMAKPARRPKRRRPAAYAATNRPAEAERLFRSEAVEQEIARIKGVLTNAKLAWMFENCFPNTLDTTVRARKDANGKDDTIVYTGDIHAMWLRDSRVRRCGPISSWPIRTSTCAACWRALSAASSSASNSIPTPTHSSIPTIRIPTTSG